MAGGGGRVVTGAGLGGKARVQNERLWVDAVISGGGGGGGGDVNIVAVGGNPVTTTVPVSDGGGSLTVDGTVVVSSITAPVTIVEPITVEQPTHDDLNLNANIQVGNVDVGAANPVPVSDNGGSITVDGTVVVSSITAPVTIVEPVSVDDNGGSLTVDGTVAVSSITTSVTPGTAATNLGKAEDAVHASGDVGVMALAVRQDTAAALAANGDYIPLTTDALGRLRVMAENFTVLPLSFSTSGQPIVVNGGGFVNIHTVAASSVDVITIYCTNVGTNDETVILGWGGVATGQQIFAFCPSQETVVVASEVVLQAGQTVQANLSTAGTCRVFGRVTRRAA